MQVQWCGGRCDVSIASRSKAAEGDNRTHICMRMIVLHAQVKTCHEPLPPAADNITRFEQPTCFRGRCICEGCWGLVCCTCCCSAGGTGGRPPPSLRPLMVFPVPAWATCPRARATRASARITHAPSMLPAVLGRLQLLRAAKEVDRITAGIFVCASRLSGVSQVPGRCVDLC
jgi:hypothetical protein